MWKLWWKHNLLVYKLVFKLRDILLMKQFQNWLHNQKKDSLYLAEFPLKERCPALTVKRLNAAHMFPLFLPHSHSDLLFSTDVQNWKYGKMNEKGVNKRQQEQIQCVCVSLSRLWSWDTHREWCIWMLFHLYLFRFVFKLFLDSFSFITYVKNRLQIDTVNCRKSFRCLQESA